MSNFFNETTPTVTYNWKDITSQFKNSCLELNTGELIKDDKFVVFNP